MAVGWVRVTSSAMMAMRAELLVGMLALPAMARDRGCCCGSDPIDVESGDRIELRWGGGGGRRVDDDKRREGEREIWNRRKKPVWDLGLWSTTRAGPGRRVLVG